MNMNQQMNMAQQPQMNNMAAYSPLNYDPMMLQQIAPVQMNQNEDMFTNLNNLNKGPSIGGMMNNNFTSQFQNNALDSAPMQQTNNIASTLGNNINLNNLNMLGVSKL
jgi:beta-xylosidase